MTSALFAQTTPDSAELTKLLQDFLAGASKNDIAMHDRFWADELVYTSALGRRKSKADIMRELSEETKATPKPEEGDDRLHRGRYSHPAIRRYRRRRLPFRCDHRQGGNENRRKLFQYRHFSETERQMAGYRVAGNGTAEGGHAIVGNSAAGLEGTRFVSVPLFLGKPEVVPFNWPYRRK